MIGRATAPAQQTHPVNRKDGLMLLPLRRLASRVTPVVNQGNAPFPPHHVVPRLGFKSAAARGFSWIPFQLGKRTQTVFPGTTAPAQAVPEHIVRPPYAKSGNPGAFMPPPTVLTIDQIAAMRRAGALASDVLNRAGKLVVPGATTLSIDDAIHDMIVEAGAYPSPLNYRGFPRSSCTSVNEVVCHGIPDDRQLQNGEIISIDVSVYLDGVHGDTCRTFYCGQVSEAAKHLVRSTKKALDAAIKVCRPKAPVSMIGDVIGRHAKAEGLSTVREFVGHGIGTVFHSLPQVFHFAHSGSQEVLQRDTCFTIEPMFVTGAPRLTAWEDGWTVATLDGGLAAQFEHTLLVTDKGVEVLTPFPNEFDEDVGADCASRSA
jgi:methionyl aminopeptidase